MKKRKTTTNSSSNPNMLVVMLAQLQRLYSGAVLGKSWSYLSLSGFFGKLWALPFSYLLGSSWRAAFPYAAPRNARKIHRSLSGGSRLPGLILTKTIGLIGRPLFGRLRPPRGPFGAAA